MSITAIILIIVVSLIPFIAIAMALIEQAKEKRERNEINNEQGFIDRGTFKQKEEAFLRKFHEQKSKKIPDDPEQELVEEDEFAGDPVYDSLDGIFGRARAKEKDFDKSNVVPAEYRVVEPTNEDRRKELEAMTVTQLKAICKEKGIVGYSSMRKPELLEILENLR